MKTVTNKITMSPIIALIFGKVLDYLADHVDELIDLIRDQFQSAKTDPKVSAAVQEFGYEPNEENLTKLHDILEEKGEDTGKLAALLVTKTVV